MISQYEFDVETYYAWWCVLTNFGLYSKKKQNQFAFEAKGETGIIQLKLLMITN